MKHADNFNSVGEGSVINYMAGDGKFSIATLNIVAGLAKFWMVG